MSATELVFRHLVVSLLFLFLLDNLIKLNHLVSHFLSIILLRTLICMLRLVSALFNKAFLIFINF